MIETITIGKFKNYRKICEYLHEPIKTGKAKQLQLEDWKRYFEYKRDGNAFVITKVYDVPKEKIRKTIIDTSNYTSNNTKNIQPMIDYLQVKFDLDANWYSFTDWYCNKLELMHKGICNAVYHPDEIDAVCEKYNISDGKLFCEYVSADKVQNPNNSDFADNESHGGEIPCELFCVTRSDLDYTDSIFDDDKMVI